jgi:nucleoid DNA-binding protein
LCQTISPAVIFRPATQRAIDTTNPLGEKLRRLPTTATPTKKSHQQTMNKVKLTEFVQKELGSTKADAERAVNAVVEGIKSHLKKSRVMQLVGFGTFKVVNRKARMGVNPKTGERIKIKASKGVKFAAGKDLKGKL